MGCHPRVSIDSYWWLPNLSVGSVIVLPTDNIIGVCYCSIIPHNKCHNVADVISTFMCSRVSIFFIEISRYGCLFFKQSNRRVSFSSHPSEQKMIDIVIFLVYLLLRSIFVRLQGVYRRLSGVYSIPDEVTPVRLESIIYRRKRDPEEISRIDDFVALHHSFAPLDILDSPHWALYALDHDNAYFVQLPHPMTYYDVAK